MVGVVYRVSHSFSAAGDETTAGEATVEAMMVPCETNEEDAEMWLGARMNAFDTPLHVLYVATKAGRNRRRKTMLGGSG